MAYNREERKLSAEKHLKLVHGVLGKNTEKSIEETKTYLDGRAIDIVLPEPAYETTKIVVENNDVVSSVCSRIGKKKVAVLDFASYVHPGGGYENGAMAQEEAICAESNLYPILQGMTDTFYAENRKCMRGGLYSSNALYIPDVVFTKTGQIQKADVIVVAAPNKNRALENHRNEIELENDMRRRIETVFHIAANNQVNTLILGAFGCGVFGNDPNFVAHEFKNWLDEHPGIFEKVVFSIPRGDNLDTFKRIFNPTKEQQRISELPF